MFELATSNGVACRRLCLLMALVGGSLLACQPSGSSSAAIVDPTGNEVVLTDGASRDLAASADTVWVAQGRRLAVLDAATLVRLPQLETEYPEKLRAVELAPDGGALYIVDEGALYRREPVDALEELVWTGPEGVLLRDIVLTPDWTIVLGHKQIFLLAANGLGDLEVVHSLGFPYPFHGTSGLDGYESVTGEWHAAFIGKALVDERMVHGLVMLSLPSPDAGEPAFGTPWFPSEESPDASVEDLLVLANPATGQDLLWVAAGARAEGATIRPYVQVLDATDILAPLVHVEWVEVSEPSSSIEVTAHKLAVDSAGEHVFVATDAALVKVGVEDFGIVGQTPATFRIDQAPMPIAPYPLGERLWSLEHQPHPFNFRTFDIDGDNPELINAGWWWVGCDAAVHAPAWRSLYLPTFGGVVRYDVSDPTNPVVIGGHFPSAGGMSYQPASEITEDADLLDLGEASRLLVARGAGGFDAFPISAAAPDPGPPTTLESTLPDLLYSEAIATWSSENGEHFVLTDATAASPEGPRFFLEAARYDPATGEFAWVAITEPVAPSPEIETPLTSALAIERHWAFLSSRGSFQIIDLSGLPDALVVTDNVIVALPGDGNLFVRGVAAAGDRLFVGIRGNHPGESEVRVYAFNAVTGKAGEVLATLDRNAPGVPDDFQIVDRIRLNGDRTKLFACGSAGRLFGFDVADPLKLKLTTTWQSPGGGNTNDCRVETFELQDGSLVEYVVFVTMSESFKLIAP